MQILLNGDPYELNSECTIAELLGQLRLDGQLAVEINREIVPRSELNSRQLQPNDTVEIVRAIGGG